ncbi:hypothetical protein Arub01_28510 [Actinomadura rubrobrunea]|uniref:DUF4190 domain-containing protein n=1 Tax=Actinomadura rubrobrunea TaxID=115335 RepID=A0A9W6UWV1_9ACTN|nr:DUF4190 domain-containing protein [Actinomadura rubrobrunea]GLW64607.1 hypothetical protein Arub01_28510 [Actinomadura rubrobrunea]
MAHPSYDPYGGYGQAYQQPSVHHHYHGVPPASAHTNGVAVASLVLGVIGFLLCGLTSIPAIICGHVATSQIKRTGEQGRGLAIGGLVLGYLVTLLWIVYLVLIAFYGVTVWSMNSGGSSY